MNCMYSLCLSLSVSKLPHPVYHCLRNVLFEGFPCVGHHWEAKTTPVVHMLTIIAIIVTLSIQTKLIFKLKLKKSFFSILNVYIYYIIIQKNRRKMITIVQFYNTQKISVRLWSIKQYAPHVIIAGRSQKNVWDLFSNYRTNLYF